MSSQAFTSNNEAAEFESNLARDLVQIKHALPRVRLETEGSMIKTFGQHSVYNAPYHPTYPTTKKFAGEELRVELEEKEPCVYFIYLCYIHSKNLVLQARSHALLEGFLPKFATEQEVGVIVFMPGIS